MKTSYDSSQPRYGGGGYQNGNGGQRGNGGYNQERDYKKYVDPKEFTIEKGKFMNSKMN